MGFPGKVVLKGAFDEIDDVSGQMREVAEGLVGDGVSFANGTSEQMGDVGLPLVDPLRRSHMNGAAACCHAGILRRGNRYVKRSSEILVATFPSQNRS